MACHYFKIREYSSLTNKNQLSSYTQANFMVHEFFYVILLRCRDYCRTWASVDF